MCGILGIVPRKLEPSPELERRFAEALRALQHRGPDAQGEFRDARVMLGHTRLSILDLSVAGSQPMRSADQRFVISYNGEVYNFRELARQHKLECLRSSSDTEVVLRLFAELGVASLPQLNGMFAFAIYDARARKIWLVRDRLGIKPLYYRLDATGLIFSSEIKGILALSPDGGVCDVAVLHEWLYYGNPLGAHTLYEGIMQLSPGHYLEVDLNSLESAARLYWSADVQARRFGVTRYDSRATVLETRRLLEQAVRRQLVSDVPVGLFLSGGIDSSAIAAFASRHYGQTLATYSAGFDFAPGAGELPRARLVADRYGTEHHELHITGDIAVDLVERMVRHHDMPFADAANIPLYLLATEISDHTKVVLQGDGGDELFGGYSRYFTMSHYRVLRTFAYALERIQTLTPKSSLHFRIRRYLRALAAEDTATSMALLLTSEDRSLTPTAVFAQGLRRRVEGYDPFARHRECQDKVDDLELANQMSLLDLMVTLPDTFLEKVDRATMAASLEVRVPFLDFDLVDFVVQLPSAVKMPWGRKKGLLKAALRGTVPDEILDGPKTGLDVPYREWLQGALKPLFFDHLQRFSRQHPEVLDVGHIERLFAQTSAGLRDDSYMLWKVMNMTIWVNDSNVSIA